MRFAYPAADQVSLASLEEVAVLDDRWARRSLHGRRPRVEPGQMVALVGSSGAGKSTLACLVPRLYDVDAGTVRLGGVDVRELTFDDIRAAVGVVTQDGHLFHDTIRANLRYAAPDATDDELWDALGAARLADLVALAARRARHRRRRAGLPAVGRRAPAADDRPAAAGPTPGRHPRRGDRPPRLASRRSRCRRRSRWPSRGARRS